MSKPAIKVRIRVFEYDESLFDYLKCAPDDKYILDKFNECKIPNDCVTSVEKLFPPNVPGIVYIDYIVTLSLKWERFRASWRVRNTWISLCTNQCRKVDSYQNYEFPLNDFSLGALIDNHVYYKYAQRNPDIKKAQNAVAVFQYDRREKALLVYYTYNKELHSLELILSTDVDKPLIVHYKRDNNSYVFYLQLNVVPKISVMKFKRGFDETPTSGTEESLKNSEGKKHTVTPSWYFHNKNSNKILWVRSNRFAGVVDNVFGKCVTLELDIEKSRMRIEEFLAYVNDMVVYCCIEVKPGKTVDPETPLKTLSELCNSNFECLWSFNGLLNYGFLVISYIADHPEFEESFRKFFHKSSSKLVNALNHLSNVVFEHRSVDLTKALRCIYTKVGEGLQIDIEKLGLKQVRSMVITPTRKLYFPPMPVMSNRILRQYMQDFCLRLGFRDDNYTPLTQCKNLVPLTVTNNLNKNVLIGNRKYMFVGCSGSQLRSHGMWLYARDDKGVAAKDIRRDMGMLDEIKCVATKVARRGQCFSSSRDGPSNMTTSGTTDTMIHCNYTTNIVDDITRNGFVFSDGAGTISPELAKEIAVHLGTGETRQQQSLYQIRYAGAKGTVSIDNTLQGAVLNVRRSMMKFESDHKVLEICKEARPTPLFLNHESIMLLEQLEFRPEKEILSQFPDNKLQLLLDQLRRHDRREVWASLHKCTIKEARSTIHSLSINQHFRGLLLYTMTKTMKDQLAIPAESVLILEQVELKKMHNLLINLHEEALHNLLDVLLHDDKAADMLSSKAAIGIRFNNLIKCGFSITSDPFFRRILLLMVYKSLGEIKTKARVPLNDGRNLMGTMDEYGVLEYGQVFVQVTNVGVIDSDVIVTKFPAVHVGDMRRLRAVNVSALHHLKDCIVFPQKGKAPHPHEMSGSDLDGDEYFVTWHTQLLECFQKENREPFEYVLKPCKKPHKKNTMTESDEYRFISDYIINDKVGIISNAIKVFGDLEPEGLFSKRCQSLVPNHSKAVDFVKSGIPATMKSLEKPSKYPDFMCKQGINPVYSSMRVLGEMYRTCRVFDDLVYKSIKSETLSGVASLVTGGVSKGHNEEHVNADGEDKRVVISDEEDCDGERDNLGRHIDTADKEADVIEASDVKEGESSRVDNGAGTTNIREENDDQSNRDDDPTSGMDTAVVIEESEEIEGNQMNQSGEKYGLFDSGTEESVICEIELLNKVLGTRTSCLLEETEIYKSVQSDHGKAPEDHLFNDTNSAPEDIKDLSSVLCSVNNDSNSLNFESQRALNGESHSVINSENLKESSARAYLDYVHIVQQIMQTYGVQTEAEVVSGVVTTLHKRFLAREDMYSFIETISVLIRECRQNFRHRFFKELRASEDEVKRMGNKTKAVEKAISWFQVAYERQVADNSKAFLSFGWIMWDILCFSIPYTKLPSLFDKIWSSAKQMFILKQEEVQNHACSSPDDGLNTLLEKNLFLPPIIYFLRCLFHSVSTVAYKIVCSRFFAYASEKCPHFPAVTLNAKSWKCMNEMLLSINVNDCDGLITPELSGGELLLTFLRFLASQKCLQLMYKDKCPEALCKAIYRHSMRMNFKLAISCNCNDALNSQDQFIYNVIGYQTPFLIQKDTWQKIKKDNSVIQLEEDLLDSLKHHGATSVKLVDSVGRGQTQGKILISGSFDAQLMAEQIAASWFHDKYILRRSYRADFEPFKGYKVE